MALDTPRPPLKSVGEYDLAEKIAEGGMGTIWRGLHRQTGEVVAVKIVPASMANNAVLQKRFEQEFKAAEKLSHPNIVRAIEYGHEGSTPYIVMEFVPGESIGQRIERDGRIPEREAIDLVVQAANGLFHAHRRGMIHRDVKPDNIMITPDGKAKLADLGLVKETESDLNLTRTGRGLGTPHFMAPEQFRNAKNADKRCDIYSLGATLYMMVTGELPFKSCGPLDAWMKKIHNEITPPRKLVPELTERLDWAIRRAMSADPNQRPESCREFVEDLTGRSTRRVPNVEADQPQQDIWFLVYVDEEGVQHTVRGTKAGIRRSLKEGRMGDASGVRASRDKKGPWEPLRSFPEFRDLVIEPAAMPLTGRTPSSPQPVAVSSPPPLKDRSLSRTNPPPTRNTARPTSAGTSSARDTAPVSRPVASDDIEVPQIEFEPKRPPTVDWALWLLLIGVAIAIGVAAFRWF
jgi:serine/threonine protein kinase